MRQIWLIGLLGIWLMGCVSEATLPSAAASATDIPTKETISAETSAETSAPAVASLDLTPVPTPEPTTPPSPTATPLDPTATPMPSPTSEPTRPALPGTELFTFAAGEPGWYTVDDNVMGGVSSSTVTIVDPDILFFSGTMSLDNNGGFASARSDWTVTDLSRADGVLLRVFGDGNTYRLRIRSAGAGRDISYNALFETTPDTWQLVYIPFAGMVPTYRGFVMDVGPLDAANIGSFGFMLSDKQPGEFELRVDWIRAVSEEEMRELAGEANSRNSQ